MYDILVSMENETKWCPRCEDCRPIGEFYVNSARYDGLSPLCAAHQRIAAVDSRNLKRIQFIEALGGKCERCGFDDYRALQVDHVNGDGNTSRREFKGGLAKFYKTVLANRADFACLCANCNWIKKYENDETLGNRVFNRTVPTEKLESIGKGNAPEQRAALERARTPEHQRDAANARWANATDEDRKEHSRKSAEKKIGKKLFTMPDGTRKFLYPLEVG